MNDSLGVIVMSGSNIANTVYGYLCKGNKYNVTAVSENIEEAVNCAKNYPKAVFIIDYNDENDKFCRDLVEKIKNHNFKAIFIFENVKDGFKFLSMGADEIITRPKDIDLNEGEKKSFLTIVDMKISKVVKEYDDNKRAIKNNYSTPIKKIIAIGSSTGGTGCVEQILKMLPADTPPVLVVQHMPPVFTGMFSQRLNMECKMTVLETEDGDTLENGKVLVAPGDKQLRLRYRDNKYYVTCKKEGPFGGHEPSVDVLFDSVADAAGKIAIGVILTGMGRDGAQGLLKMRRAGALTLGQDEGSSIVYGMPKAAYDLGAVSVQGDLIKIGNLILQNI